MAAPLAAVLIPIFIKEGKKLLEERDQKKNAKREARNELPTSRDLGSDSNLSAKQVFDAIGVQKSIGLAKKGYRKALGKSKGKGKEEGKEDAHDGGLAGPSGQDPVIRGYDVSGDWNNSQNQQWRGQPGFQISRGNMLGGALCSQHGGTTSWNGSGGDDPRHYGNQQYDPRYPLPTYVDNRSMQGHGQFQHDPRNYPGGQRHEGVSHQHGALVNGRHASNYDYEQYRGDPSHNQQRSFGRAGLGGYEHNGIDHDGFDEAHRHEHQNGQRTNRSSEEERRPENDENDEGDSGCEDFHGSSDSEDEDDGKSSGDQKGRDTSMSHRKRA